MDISEIENLNIYDKQHTKKWLYAAYHYPVETLKQIKDHRDDITIDDLDPRPEHVYLIPTGRIVVTSNYKSFLDSFICNSDQYQSICDFLIHSHSQLLGHTYKRKYIANINVCYIDISICYFDILTNLRSTHDNTRTMTIYTLSNINIDKQKIYLITEWDRSKTTILLAEDY